jgi:D-beta-D-heptose 7-phosphate kinase/D-beta-D-heptose 1-phosphate adenosyltransferase
MPYRFIILIAVLLLNGFFAAAEVALVSVRKSRLRALAEQGQGGAQAALNLLANPGRLLSVTQVGVTLASLGLAFAANAEAEPAIEFALLAAGVVVQKAGTATVSADEVIEAEIIDRMAPAEAKIATIERVAREAAKWRERGLKVGFTNGCFDILHRGHIAYLAQAREWCDRLIVGVNSDRWVSTLKGPGRPVNDLESRALVLAGLRSVDLVAPFDEETPLRLIEAARPDVLVKGADYTLEGVVGRELVEGWGGEVRLADLVDGHSTTATIAKLARRRA